MPQVLDRKFIDGITPPATGKRLIADSRQRNLYLRVMPTGAMTFEMRSHAGGKWTIKKLGAWPTMSVDQARRKCAGELGKIDPTVDQKRTLLEVADDWFSTKNHQDPKETRRYIDLHLKPLLQRQITSIRSDELWDLFKLKYKGDPKRGVKATPSAAVKLSIFTAGIFKHAAKRDWVAKNPLAGSTLSDWGAVKPVPREVALTHDEIRLAWAMPVPHGTLYRLLLCGGQRFSETQALATYPENIKGDVWQVGVTTDPKSNKSRRPHKIPVLPLMREVLAQPMKLKGACAAWQYWQRIPLRPDDDPLIPGRRVTQHDIRHTVASGMKELGIAPNVIEALINHKDGYLYQTSADMQPLFKKALAKWHKKLREIVGE